MAGCHLHKFTKANHPRHFNPNAFLPPFKCLQRILIAAQIDPNGQRIHCKSETIKLLYSGSTFVIHQSSKFRRATSKTIDCIWILVSSFLQLNDIQVDFTKLRWNLLAYFVLVTRRHLRFPLQALCIVTKKRE